MVPRFQKNVLEVLTKLSINLKCVFKNFQNAESSSHSQIHTRRVCAPVFFFSKWWWPRAIYFHVSRRCAFPNFTKLYQKEISYFRCVNWANIVMAAFKGKNGTDVVVIMYAGTLWNMSALTLSPYITKKGFKSCIFFQKIMILWNHRREQIYLKLSEFLNFYKFMRIKIGAFSPYLSF